MKLFHKGNKMLIDRILRLKFKFMREYSTYSSRISHQTTDLSVIDAENPQYPLIVDRSEEGQNKYWRGQWYESVKAMPTVEEKLFELAIQQKSELKTYSLSNLPPMYNGVYFYNYITRTHTINNLPKNFTSMNVDKELSEIKEPLCETLLNYYCNIWNEKKFGNLSDYLCEKNTGANLASSLISQCFKKLSFRNDYVFNSTVS